MRICLVNPNSTTAMTAEMVQAARSVAAADVEIEGATVASAPATIEGYRDEALAAAGVVELLESIPSEFDAFLIACFGDPGLHAARQVCTVPVVGIAEASFALSLSLGQRFAILTNTAPDIPEMEELVHRYSLDGRSAGVWAVDLGVAAADGDRERATEAYRRAGEEALRAGAEVLCLGCGPMVGLRQSLEQVMGAPVVEPVPAGVGMAEALVRLGHTTSKVRAFQSREVSAP